MEVHTKHLKEQLSAVKWILGGMLVVALALNVLMGQSYYKADADNKRLDFENEALQNDIECLEGREDAIVAKAYERTIELVMELEELKERSKNKEDGITADLEAVLADLDTMEFYPLYVKVSEYGGAEAQDKLRN